MQPYLQRLLPFMFYLMLWFFPSQLFGQTEIKFNMASALLLVPNFGVEIPIRQQSSVQLDVLGSFWDSIDDSAYHINQTFLEYRWYQKPKRHGWFLGIHIGYGMFTLRKPNLPGTYGYSKGYYQSGRNMYYGITLGYKKTLSDHWAIEGFVRKHTEAYRDIYNSVHY